jgi:hypothetical protein
MNRPIRVMGLNLSGSLMIEISWSVAGVSVWERLKAESGVGGAPNILFGQKLKC